MFNLYKYVYLTITISANIFQKNWIWFFLFVYYTYINHRSNSMSHTAEVLLLFMLKQFFL